ncbi:MAG: DOPA 4,5-dioxygenase family protein [Pseudomonadota bacterium]
MSKRPTNAHARYHAHLYYDEKTLEMASQICDQAGELFDIEVGRKHQKNVGPHPRWSCQMAFEASEFDTLIPWLDQHRQGLTVFVHGRTGDDLADHTTYAYWLGEEVQLNIEMFTRAKD